MIDDNLKLSEDSILVLQTIRDISDEGAYASIEDIVIRTDLSESKVCFQIELLIMLGFIGGTKPETKH